MMEGLLSLWDVSLQLDGRSILEAVTLEVRPGELVALIGPNGAGKTTLLRVALGVLPYQKGEVRVFGKSPAQLTPADRARIGYVPQALSFDRSQPMLVSELLAAMAPPSARNRQSLLVSLRAVDSEHLLNQSLRFLSGGELQRVIIAAALAHQPKLLLLDEPGTGIDAGTRLQFYDLIEQLRQTQDIGALMISHDLSVVSRYATRVACIHHRLLYTGSPEEVLSMPVLEQLYGHPVAVYHHSHEEERHG
jgi:zinc transport system ATP-binding protein